MNRISYANVVSTLALLLAVGGGSYAIAASSNAPLHACAKKHGGALRLASKCAHNERAVKLAQVGPAGPTGPAGASGSSGVTGKEGPPSFVGATTLTWGSQMTDTHGDLVWRLQRTIGTFTKAAAGSRILVTVGGTMSSDRFSCFAQVRVDGLTANGTSDTGVFEDTSGATGLRGPGAELASPYSGSLVEPFSITADFGALAAGVHTVSLWTASNEAPNNCSTDPYNYKMGTATVLETG